jgi:hypothetical protein
MEEFSLQEAAVTMNRRPSLSQRGAEMVKNSDVNRRFKSGLNESIGKFDHWLEKIARKVITSFQIDMTYTNTNFK